MTEYNPFFETAGMTRVDISEDQKFLDAVKKLEKATGLRRELLSSKSRNMAMLSKMNKEQLQVVQRFALNHGVSDKFRRKELIEPCKRMERDALAEALSLARGAPICLYWKKPGSDID